jgi:hypothetical protein
LRSCERWIEDLTDQPQEETFGREPVQNFGRVIVHPGLNLQDPAVTDSGEIGAFGEEAADDVVRHVVLLYQSIFPGLNSTAFSFSDKVPLRYPQWNLK